MNHSNPIQQHLRASKVRARSEGQKYGINCTLKYEYNDRFIPWIHIKPIKERQKNWWQRKKIHRQIKFMKYIHTTILEGECPALALGLWHISSHPQFSFSYCGHILKKTHQPRDIRLKMKVGSAMSGCKTLWCDFALVGNSHWLRLKWYTKKMWGPK